MTIAPGDRDAMEAERDFLLRSLDDLDAELLAGNIDPGTYRTLHDDYTARAADVVRTLDGGGESAVPGKVAAQPVDEPRRTPALRVVTGGGVVLFCVLVAFLLARAVGDRRPGQTITGNAAATPGTARPEQLRGTHRQRPFADGRSRTTAMRCRSTPPPPRSTPRNQSRSRTGVGSAPWSRRQVDDTQTRTTLVNRALRDFDRAIAVAPKYVDAYFFKGYTLLKLADKPKQAVPALQRFLVLAPQDDPQRQQVLGVLAEAEGAAASSKP